MQEIRESLKKLSLKRKKAYQPFIEYFKNKLTDDMSAMEIAQLLAIIESIQYKNQRLGKIISQKKGTVLDDFASKPPALSDNMIASLRKEAEKTSVLLLLGKSEDKEFLNIMEDIHKKLGSMLGKMLITANSEDPSSIFRLDYPPERVKGSFYINRIMETSKAEKLPDNTNILSDIRRDLVSFSIESESNIKPTSSYKDSQGNILSDDSIRTYLQEFAGDKIEVEGSQANKIFHFGNQYLHAELLHEFKIATDYMGEKVSPQMTDGTIHWKKLKNSIEAEINLNVFSISVQGMSYALNTEGTNLQKLPTGKRGDEVLASLSRDTKTKPKLRAPLASIKTTVRLSVKDNKYFFEPKHVTIKYYTDQLTCMRARLLPKNFQNRADWDPIKTILALDVEINKDVRSCVKLLETFNEEEWTALKEYVNTNPFLKEKLAKLYVKGELFGYIEGVEASILRNHLFKIKSFEEKVSTVNRLKIDEYVERFTPFFKKLKDESHELCLQEPVGIIQDLMKEGKSEDLQSILFYIVRKVDAKSSLTRSDCDKIRAIKNALNQVTETDDQLRKIIDPFTLAINKLIAEKELQKPQDSVGEAQGEYKGLAKTVLLATEARIHINKIKAASKKIGDDLPLISDSREKVALESLQEKLGYVSKALEGAIVSRSVTLDLLTKEIRQTNNAIQASKDAIKAPSNFFSKLFESLKNIFIRKRPSLLKEIKDHEPVFTYSKLR